MRLSGWQDPRQVLRTAAILIAFAGLRAPVVAQTPDLLGDNIPFSGATLHLRPYATLPSGTKSIISMTTRPGDSRLYVTTQQGTIYAIDDDGAGHTNASPWFDVAGALASAGETLTLGFTEQGLQSTAFHPDFANPTAAGYGRLYTTSLQFPPASDMGRLFLGDTQRGSGVPADSVLAEWTYNHASGQVDPGSYRELFRVKLPTYMHLIKQAQFNLFAQPNDADYGLLYITHGDGSPSDSSGDRPQLLGNALGKMLRIDPLPAGATPYAIPGSNPFAGNEFGILPEIYAYGFRNPHTYSFNRDTLGKAHIIVGDIGRNNIEEVNIVTAGGNFGWAEREGTFVHFQNIEGTPNSGYFTGVGPLPVGEANVLDAYDQRYTYPVAQYDHNGPGVMPNDSGTGAAIASSFVIQNSSDPALYHQLIFNDFGNQNGYVYQVDFNAALAAVTQLNPDDPTRDQPSELTQAPISRLHLALDDDNNPNTPSLPFDDLNVMLGAPRNDIRYGEGLGGEMYLSSKQNGVIYLVENSLPLDGDFNKNGVVDGVDFLEWQRGESPNPLSAADFNDWKANFGAPSLAAAAQNVPEPANVQIALVAATLACLSGRLVAFL